MNAPSPAMFMVTNSITMMAAHHPVGVRLGEDQRNPHNVHQASTVARPRPSFWSLL